MPEPASWRDDTAQPVQDDLDALAQAAFDAAHDLMARHRDFQPFAVTLGVDGQQARVASDPGPGAEPSAPELLEGVVAAVRDARARYRAVGFVALVFTRAGDAVRVELEHRDGGPALVLLATCRVGRLVRRVRMGPVGGSEGSPLVWPRA